MSTREIADATAIKFNEALRDSYSDLSVGHRRLLATMIHSALQQAIADERERQWQPIETAPKTGEEVLLGHGNSVWADEWWDNSFWLQCATDGTHAGEVPTHWQPLPPPPAVRREREVKGNNE